MSTTLKYVPAGLNYILWGYVNSSGYCTGNQSSLTAGDQDGAGLGRLYGAKTAPVEVNEPDYVESTGDDKTLMQHDFDSIELARGVIESAVVDLELEAALQSTQVRTFGEVKLGALQPSEVTRPDILLIVQGRAKSYDSGSRGQSRYSGYIIPMATLKPLGGAKSERTPQNSRYGFTANIADTDPWGATLQTALAGTESLAVIPIGADNPVDIHVWKGDGIEQVFNLGRASISSAKMYIWINGVAQLSGWTLDTDANTITFDSAPDSDAMITALYEFNPNG